MKRLLALAAAGVLAVILALPGAALAAGGTAPAASATPTASPGTSATSPPAGNTPARKPSPPPSPPAPPTGPGKTFSGPHMYNPSTASSDFPYASTVTVSQTTSLVNQMVQVSWTGFTPSSSPAYNNTSTDYPVMIAECKGTSPTAPDQCYQATNGGEPATSGPDGLSNAAYGTTGGSGSGTADILVSTSGQNHFLGCDAAHPCSLVVVPSQGGDAVDFSPPHCDDHTSDRQFLDLGQYAFQDLPLSSCSWRQRITIPLSFAPAPGSCPLRTADFTAAGSPMLASAMAQWQAGFCQGSSAVEVQYNSSASESEARSGFLSGLDDIAFTTQPVASATGGRAFTYAPVAVSAVSVAYWVDNVRTGQPYTGLKLDPRLVAKLLTTSYAFRNDGCPQAAHGRFGCDNAVNGDPLNLYRDPEFEELNPTVGQDPAQPSGSEIPTVVSGVSDMTWTATSWIAADTNAAAFVAGQFDNWGHHVNSHYLGLRYPTDAFLPMDPYLPVSVLYSPVYPLATVATDQAENIQPGTQDTRDPSTGNYDALPPQIPGDRDLWTLTDQGDAARFLFPTAALENADGKYVQPTDTSMAAAVSDMTVNPDGITRTMNFAKKDPAAYPLTMVIYAIVPTSGVSAAKAAEIARFLDDVAGAGQTTGTAPGQLAPGYLPLPSALRQQTLTAAAAVLRQAGIPPSAPSASSTPSATTSPGTPATSPAGFPTVSAGAPGSIPASPGSSAAHEISVSFGRPDSVGMSWVVLALLITGGVFLLAGPAALLYGTPAYRAALIGGMRQVRATLPGWPALRRPGWRSLRSALRRPDWRSLWQRKS